MSENRFAGRLSNAKRLDADFSEMPNTRMKITLPSKSNRSQIICARICLSLLASTIPLSTFGAPPAKPAKPAPSEPPLPLKVVVGVVQKTVAEYQAALSPKLDAAEFTFKVQTENAQGISIGAWIITVGFTRTEGNSIDVTFNYQVPTPSPTPAAPGPKPPTPQLDIKSFSNNINMLAAVDTQTLANAPLKDFVDILAAGTKTPKIDMQKFHDRLLDAIKGAAQAVQDAPAIGKVEFEKFAITLLYSVKYEGSGAASIPVFSFLSIGPKVSANQNSTQSVKLTFKLPKPSASPAASASPSVSPSQ